MKKRFIILIDLSEYSNNLIKYACHWGQKANAELLLVHQSIVLAPALSDNESKLEITQHTNEDALQQLKLLAGELIPPTVKVSYWVSETNLQLTLAKLLEDPYHDLIFTGLKKAGFLKKYFVGSVALRIIENIENTIVSLPKETSVFSVKKLLVAVTEKYPLNILELNKFLDFMDEKNTSLTFFYLAKPKEDTTQVENRLSELSALFSGRVKTKTAIYEAEAPLTEIQKLITNNEEELLIVQRGTRLLTDHLFRRFLINELVYEAQTPLIVLP